jgi:NlpC/P60 family
MKHLFFLAMLIGLFPGSIVLLSAQNNVNLYRNNSRINQSISIKFIDGVELNSDPISTAVIAVEEKGTLKLHSISNTITPTVKGNFLKNIENCTSIQFKYAMIMDREVESIHNLELYNFINEWWAIRYRYGGSDQNGIDCSSFTEKLLSKVYGFSVPRTSKEQFLLCSKVATKNLVEGDLVFFNTRSTKRRRRGISHVGLYLGNNYFVHSSVQYGVTISSLVDEYYSNKFISGGRVSGTR